jgi:hypothetical protein
MIEPSSALFARATFPGVDNGPKSTQDFGARAAWGR